MGLIRTTDCEAAYTFYVGVLRFKLVTRDGSGLVLQSGDDTFQVMKVPEFRPSRDPVLGWEVANLEETVLWLKSRGVAVLQEDASGFPDERLASFNDPDGNVLVVIQRT